MGNETNQRTVLKTDRQSDLQTNKELRNILYKNEKAQQTSKWKQLKIQTNKLIVKMKKKTQTDRQTDNRSCQTHKEENTKMDKWIIKQTNG